MISQLFQTKDLKAKYLNEEPVFWNANISANSGEVVCLTGGNGSGKTTFFKAIAGVCYESLPQVSGEIIFLNKLYHNLSDFIRSGLIGIVFQERFVFPKMNVRDHFELAARKRRLLSSRLSKVFDTFPDLFPLRFAQADKLSGGERALLAFAIAFISEPKLLLLDEPFANLDITHTNKLRNLILQLKNEHKLAIIVIEHRANELRGLYQRHYDFNLGNPPTQIT